MRQRLFACVTLQLDQAKDVVNQTCFGFELERLLAVARRFLDVAETVLNAPAKLVGEPVIFLQSDCGIRVLKSSSEIANICTNSGASFK